MSDDFHNISNQDCSDHCSFSYANQPVQNRQPQNQRQLKCQVQLSHIRMDENKTNHHFE